MGAYGARTLAGVSENCTKTSAQVQSKSDRFSAVRRTSCHCVPCQAVSHRVTSTSTTHPLNSHLHICLSTLLSSTLHLYSASSHYTQTSTPPAHRHIDAPSHSHSHTHTRPCALNQMSPRPSAPMAFTRTAMVPTAPATETTRDTGKTAQAALRARQARYGHTADFFTQCL
jgi:hypothetical protein